MAEPTEQELRKKLEEERARGRALVEEAERRRDTPPRPRQPQNNDGLRGRLPPPPPPVPGIPHNPRNQRKPYPDPEGKDGWT